MNSVLSVNSLAKSYLDFNLRAISFELPTGYIMGLIGPNGSGKTTTIRAILNMIERDAGNITVFGQNNIKAEQDIKKNIGVVFDTSYELTPQLKERLIGLRTFPTGFLLEGLSFAATVLAMTTAYTFSIAEKNSLERFYGFLPVDRKRLVRGRYLAIFGIGYISILLEAMVQSLILIFIKPVPLHLADIAFSTLACTLLFSIYAGVQIPGYYKYGSIKGKIFMFIPTAGFLILYYLFRLLKSTKTGAGPDFLSNTGLLAAFGCILIVLILAISVSVSNRIMNHIKY